MLRGEEESWGGGENKREASCNLRDGLNVQASCWSKAGAVPCYASTAQCRPLHTPCAASPVADLISRETQCVAQHVSNQAGAEALVQRSHAVRTHNRLGRLQQVAAQAARHCTLRHRAEVWGEARAARGRASLLLGQRAAISPV